MAVSISSSASSNWSGSLFSDRRPKAACLKAATSFSKRSIRSSLRRSRASATFSIRPLASSALSDCDTVPLVSPRYSVTASGVSE